MSQENLNQDKSSTDSSKVNSLVNGDVQTATSSEKAQKSLDLSELIDLGNQLLDQEKFSQALDCYEQIVKTANVALAPIYHNLGDIYTQLGQTDEAIAAYHYALKFKHNFQAWSHNNLADALRKKQQWEVAITHYQQAIQLGINFLWSYHNLGEAFSQIQQWDGAIDAYNGAIKINPDSAWSHHNLGKALSEKQEWEAAIIHYRRAVELDPMSYLFNHSLAVSCSQQQHLDEAVEAYSRAVEINSNASYEDYRHLVKILIQKGNLTKAISTYSQALTINIDWAKVEKWNFLDDLASLNSRVITAEQLAIISQTAVTKESATKITSNSSNQGFVFYGPYINCVDGFYWVQVDFEFPVNENHPDLSTNNQLGFKFDIVTESGKRIWYKNDVSINLEKLEIFVELNGANDTEFRFEAVGVAFTVKQIKLTLLGDSSENYTNAYYFDLGKILQNQTHFSGAIIAYRYAIELGLQGNSDVIECAQQFFLQMGSEQAEFQGKLGLLMVRQFGLDVVLNCYHQAWHNKPEYAGAYYQLGILLAEAKMMDAALVCFEKAPNKQLHEGKIYKRIWQGLNQLGPLVDETNPIYTQKISLDAAYEYFRQNSKYTSIYLHNMSESDLKLLETLGLSVANLKLINEDSLFLEEIYINSFGCEQRHELANKSQRKDDFSWSYLNKTTEFQKSLVETGYIYSVCPVTGKIVRSNQSIAPMMPESYGLGTWAYRFVGDLVFYIVVSGWEGQKITIYIPKHELIVNLSEIWVNNIDYAGLINTLKAFTLENWPKIVNYISNQGSKNIVSISCTTSNLGHYFWNDLSGLLYLHDNEILDRVTHFFVENRYLNSNICDIFPEISHDKITLILDDSQRNEVRRRIIDDNCVAVRVTNTVITEELVNRIHKTALKLCTSNFIDEVKNARQHFPLIWINLRSHNKSWINQIEGYACLIKEIYNDYPNMAVLFDGFPQEKDVMDKIINLIPASVKVYNGLDCSLFETIIWAFAIDTYIAVVGSGLTVVTWIANKPGVAHSERIHLNQQFWWREVRENMVLPTFISSEHIKEVVGADGNAFYCNYDCDWQIIYQEVVKIVASLKSSM